MGSPQALFTSPGSPWYIMRGTNLSVSSLYIKFEEFQVAKEETMNYRGLFKWAGISALVFAVVGLAGYVISLATNGFMMASTTAPSPDRIIQMALARGNQVASRLDLLSYFFWIPALVGIFGYLRGRTRGRAYIGAALAGLAVMSFLVTSILGSVMIGLARGPVTENLRGQLTVLDQVAFSFQMHALLAITACNLLWGMALRSQGRLSKTVGNLFLAQVAVFLLTNLAFIASSDRFLNIGISLFNLAFILTFAAAGILLWRESQKEPEIPSTIETRTRAAGASA